MRIEREKQLQIRFSKYCELPESTENKTFDTFNAYNRVLADWLITTYDLVFGNINFLLLSSDVDRGKTHLLIAACRAFMAKNVSAKYTYVPILLDELRAGFQNKDDHSYDARFHFYQRVGFLGLDDLGSEVRTAWSIEKLEEIINYRYENKLPTMVTTNCLPDEFTDRIRSRFKRWENGKILSMDSKTTKEYTDFKKTKNKEG